MLTVWIYRERLMATILMVAVIDTESNLGRFMEPLDRWDEQAQPRNRNEITTCAFTFPVRSARRLIIFTHESITHAMDSLDVFR